MRPSTHECEYIAAEEHLYNPNSRVLALELSPELRRTALREHDGREQAGTLPAYTLVRVPHLLIERGCCENSESSVLTDREAAVVPVEARV